MTTVLVASTGGHLSELYELSARFTDLEPPFQWVTFPTPQSEAVLAEELVCWASYTGQRDWGGVLRNVPLANRLLSDPDVSAVVTTGAAIALSFLPLARAKGLDAHYIEGIARTDGPSVTGRLLRAVPGVRFYTQWAGWADERWRFRGSVFDRFTGGSPPAADAEIRRVVVMLGTMPYGFRRLVDRLLEILPTEAEVTWQVGHTQVDDLPIQAQSTMTPRELDHAIEQADLVVAHAGGGSALQVMGAGKCPLLVPREAAHGEHVDDHQVQLARLLPELGLAVGVRVQDLAPEHLLRAAGTRVSAVGRPPVFRLG